MALATIQHTTIALLLFGLTLSAGAMAQTPKEESALDTKQINMVKIAALTGKGDLAKLPEALRVALDEGMTVNEVSEVMVHTYAYAGFPRSLRGLQTLIGVLDERKAKGIRDNFGREASPIADKRSKYERGRDILAAISGVPADAPKAGYAKLAPEIEVFLKEHLFADLFERDVLTYAERELATVSILATIGNVEPMLRSHLTICLHVGLTPEQLQQYIVVLKSAIGKKEAKSAQKVLDEVIKK